MAFLDFELSKFWGKPIELYKFVHGTDTFCYSSVLKEVTYDEEVYLPISIGREQIGQTSELAKSDLTVHCPVSSPIAQLYLMGSPENVTTLTIVKQHDGTDGEIVLWKGRVVTVVANYPTLDFSCEPIFSMQKRNGLRPRFLRNCRHVVYGSECRADKDSFAIAGTVSEVVEPSTSLTSPIAATYPDGYFIAGMIEVGGASRFIIEHVGSTLTLASPIANIEADTAVDLYPGCDHSIVDCTTKFDNLANNGAFPWIPTENPFEGSIV